MNTTPKSKSLITWCHEHPFSAIALSAAFASLATAAALVDHWYRPCLIMFAALQAFMGGLIWWQTRPTVVLLLCAALLSPFAQARAAEPRPAQDEGGTGGSGCAAAGVAVVVVVVVGVVIFRTVKFCQKKFPKDKPKPTNAPPEELTFALGGAGGGGSESDAAAINYAEMGSCYCEEGDGTGGAGGPQGGTFEFTLDVSAGAEPGEALVKAVDMQIRRGPEATQDWAGFAREVEQLGVTVTGHAGQFSFAHNGRPVDAQASPISWDPARRVVKVSKGSPSYYTVFVHRSRDMKVWTELLRMEVPVGSKVLIQDANPHDQVFYKFGGLLSD